jgi:hypothetical protein
MTLFVSPLHPHQLILDFQMRSLALAPAQKHTHKCLSLALRNKFTRSRLCALALIFITERRRNYMQSEWR